MLSVQYIKIFYRNFYDITIFTQPLRAICLERLRENCDVIEISVEYFNVINRELSTLLIINRQAIVLVPVFVQMSDLFFPLESNGRSSFFCASGQVFKGGLGSLRD